MNPDSIPYPMGRQIRNSRPLGMMVVHSPAGPVLETDIKLAVAIGADLVEILPRWNELPRPNEISDKVKDAGLEIWSTHGPWGGQSIEADRVDLSDIRPQFRQDSIDDVRRALDWSASLGARIVVVHPGGLSDPDEIAERTDLLTQSLDLLSLEAGARGLRIGLENMPKGVYPGSRMADLAGVVRQIQSPSLGLVMDTGHARISGEIREETLAAKDLLISTHVHDNDGRADSHRPPGEGVIDWPLWFSSLSVIGYEGPIMLECVKALRDVRKPPSPEWLEWWKTMIQG
jgi:sugar phosphate isomerase/epimerase